MSAPRSRNEDIKEASRFLGNLEPGRIASIGEDPDRYRRDYRVLSRFTGIKSNSRATAG